MGAGGRGWIGIHLHLTARIARSTRSMDCTATRGSLERGVNGRMLCQTVGDNMFRNLITLEHSHFETLIKICRLDFGRFSILRLKKKILQR